MKQELYINGQKADIKDDSLILFTYQQSDYSDPTSIKNSYTKSVTLPGTKNNCRIFNEIYRFDYIQNADVFNPSKRTQFQILSNGTLLEQGYLKLIKITRQGEYREFQISLYGSLGDFMYSLQYNADGDKLTMYDIVSYDYADLDFDINRETVKEAWDWINGDRSQSSKWGSINFAPCYNGIPESDNFDPKKIALYCAGKGGLFFSPVFIHLYSGDTGMDGLPTISGDYKPYEDNNGEWWSLIEVGDDMDEWQVGDHRSWMQRPIFSIRFLFRMIENYLRDTVDPKFTMVLDDTWFNDKNPYWNDLWITLPLLYENKEDVKSGDNITHKTLFENTKTPYEYLTSYTKSFGLWYDYDTTTRTVEIKPRYRFYDSTVKNITDRIDVSNMKIDPLSFSFRTLKYDWKEGEDSISESYQKKTGDNYGVYGVDTGWEFDNSSKTVPSNQIMKSAVDVRNKGIYLSTVLLGYDSSSYPGGWEVMPQWMWSDDMKYYLYNKNNPEDTKLYNDIKPDLNAPNGLDVLYSGLYINGAMTGELNRDGVPKPMFCDDDNKSVDGSDVFLLYTGKDSSDRWYKATNNTTYNPSELQNQRYITDDVDGFDLLNENKHCWIDTTRRTGELPLPYATSTDFPKFNRMDLTNKNVDWSLDFGKPAQTYVYSDLVYPETSSISRKTFLDRYISDLYNVNTRVVETKMRIEDPHKAIHTVFYFSNSLWVINKMTDFNYENNLTTVQFIKVNDIKNYIIDFKVSPSTYTCNSAAQGLDFDFGFEDYEYITWTVDVSWLTLFRNATTKKPGLIIQYNAGDTTREGHIWFSYGTNTQKITITQTSD